VSHHSILRPESALLLFLALGPSGCSGEDGTPSGTGGTGSDSGYCQEDTAALVNGSGAPEVPAAPIAETPIEGSSCNAVERQYPQEYGAHTPAPCVEIDYSTNPPCTGTHYGTWAAYRVYDEPVPRGFWVHSLEHGAVAFLYSCTDCDDEVARAIGVLDDAGDDALCTSRGSPVRLTLLTPDPRLDTPWAAASWGYTLTADCFEPEVFRAFLDAHRGLGPEIACSDGLDVSLSP
jgi:hypothetical protein